MDNKEITKIMKKRKALMFFLSIITTVGIMIILLSRITIIAKIAIAFSISITYFAIIVALNQHDKRVLRMDMNPLKYYAHIHFNNKPSKKPLTDDGDIAYLLGDYNKALEIYQNVLNDAKNDAMKLLTMTQMLMAFFEINDYDTAKRIIADASKLKVKGVEPKIYFGFYNAYFCGDYDTAIKLYKDNLANDLKNNIVRARMSLYLGMAYYKKGDIENARAQFTFVNSFCPMLNYSKIAKQYLDNM